MLITYRGRQYDSTKRGQIRDLANALGIDNQLDRLKDHLDGQRLIDEALWAALLSRGPGSLTAEQVGGAR